MKALAIICGIGLAILWIAGLNSPMAAGWLTWLDGIAAIFAFVVASSDRTRTGRMATPTTVAAGLFALWIIGLVTNGLAWQNWWTFTFACLMTIAAAVGNRPQIRTGFEKREGVQGVETRDRFRRSA